MRQNESNLTMTTDVAVTTNTTNMEEKGMKGFFKNMKKKVSQMRLYIFSRWSGDGSSSTAESLPTGI